MKRLISICLLVSIVFCSFVYAAGSGDRYQEGYNDGYNRGYSDGSDNESKPREPNIIFIEQVKIPEVEAGGNLNLTFDYKNDSQYTACDIRITPSFDDVPLVYERPVVYESKKNLRREATNTASFSFKVKDDAKIGVYEIKFKVEYKNTSDVVYSRDRVAYFKVTKEKVVPIITVNNIITEPDKINAGSNFTLRFNVNNIGGIDAKDTYVKLTGLGVDGFMPVDGNDFVYVGNIPAKKSVTLTFSMIASSKIPKGTNTIGATITYTGSDNSTKYTEEKVLYIMNVLSKNETADTTSGKPKIIIESYGTNPANIVAGDVITFTFRFKNTSKDKAVKNMKITISSTEGEFMIANGSNTFYIESLAAGASSTKSIDLNVKQDLTSKSYPLNINFDYEDTSAEAYNANEIINIPVVEYSKLVINNIGIGDGMVDNQTNLSFDYINMGKARVANLTASVEGDYKATQDINYIGNLEAGNTDYYDIMVTPTKEGENVGTLILTFEDSSGKKIEVKKEFTGYASTMPSYNPDDYNPDDPGKNPVEPTEEPLNIWMLIGIGFGSFLVSFIITKVITTKIVRKRLEDEI